MSADETHLSFEQPRSMFGTWLGVVLLFAIFGLFVWVVMGAMPRGDDYEKKRATARADKLKTARDEANGALNGYAWVDKAKGTVRVPIHRAMELTVAELAQKKPVPGTPIAPDLQPGLQTTAPVTPPSAPVAQPVPAASPKASMTEGEHSENRGQKAAENNPPNAAPATQPGPSTTPAASAPPGAIRPQPGVGQPTATPVQSAPGTPLPVPGKKP